MNSHTEIELLAIPKSAPDILGDIKQTAEMHNKLHDLVKGPAWIEDEPPNYEWQGKRYLWKLTTLKDKTQWTIAQIIHTGPSYFIKWLKSSSEHRKGAMPWGYSIRDYALFNNNNVPISINSDSEFFETLGYLPISLEDRSDGNANYWRTFKLVENIV